MSKRIEDLDPLVQPKARTFLSLIPIPYVVTSTLRTLEEQGALYARGRKPLDEVNALRSRAGMYLLSASENTYTVTNCDGVRYKSNHQGGRALDVVPANVAGNPIWPPATDPRWEMLAKCGEAAGFSWGGRWNPPDLPHYEMENI